MTLSLESKYSFGLLNCSKIYKDFAADLCFDFSGRIRMTKNCFKRENSKQDFKIVFSTTNEADSDEWKHEITQYLEEFFIKHVAALVLEIPERIQKNDTSRTQLRERLQALNTKSSDYFFRIKTHSNLELTVDAIGTKRPLFERMRELNEIFSNLMKFRDVVAPTKTVPRHSLAPSAGLGNLPSLMSLVSPPKQFVYRVDANNLLYKVMTNLRENIKDFKACLKEKFGTQAALVQNQSNLDITYTPSSPAEAEKDWLTKAKRFVVEYENRHLARLEIDLKAEFVEFGETNIQSILSDFAYFVAIKYQEATKLSIASRVFMYDFSNDDTLLVIYGSAIQIEQFRDEQIAPELERIKSNGPLITNVAQEAHLVKHKPMPKTTQAVKFSYRQFFKEYNVLYNFKS